MMRWSRLQNRPTDRRQILISLSEELSKSGRRERRLYPQLNQTFSSGSNGWWLQIRRRGNDSTHTHQNHKSNWYWRSNFVPWALESNQEKACCKKVQKSKWLRKSLNLVQNYSEFRLKYGPMSWIWSWNSHEFGPTKWLWKTQWNTSVCVRLFSGQTLSHKWGWS